MKVINGLSGLLLTMVASFMFILMGVLYFMLSVWIIKLGASWAGYSSIDGGMVVLGACIVTAGIVIGSAIQK
jgi:hypothetical protein